MIIMGNKGFTLIEVLAALVLVAIGTVTVLVGIRSTLSVGNEEAYKIMKNNIVSASYDYILECDEKLITCDFSFDENNRFSVQILKEYGYFTDLESPLDGKDLGSCLYAEAFKENGVVSVQLIDDCY